MKKILLTSLILVLVPTLVFLPLYLFLLYTATTSAQNFSNDIQGKWSAIQYYEGSERVACNENNYITVTFDDTVIKVEGTVLPTAETEFTWKSGISLTYEVDGQVFSYVLSFDNNKNLKITVENTPYIIILRRSVG